VDKGGDLWAPAGISLSAGGHFGQGSGQTGRPGLLLEAAGPDCTLQAGFWSSSDRAWPDGRYLQALE